MEIEVISRPFIHEGRPAVLTLVIDVTDRQAAVAVARETEDRYRALVEGLPDGVTVHIGRTIVFANESIARILGLRSAQDLIGRDVLDFLPREELEERRRSAPRDAQRRAGSARANTSCSGSTAPACSWRSSAVA